MDWVNLHATINEVPAAGIIIGTFLLVISAVAGGRSLKKIAFTLFAAASVCSVLAFLTGAPAETALQDSPGMSRLLVEQHRYAARLAVSLAALLGFIGIVAIRSMSGGRALSRMLLVLALSVALATIAATGWGVYSGILVHNAEVQAEYPPSNKPRTTAPEPKKKEQAPNAPRAVPLT
jgi:hypothetical protein